MAIDNWIHFITNKTRYFISNLKIKRHLCQETLNNKNNKRTVEKCNLKFTDLLTANALNSLCTLRYSS